MAAALLADPAIAAGLKLGEALIDRIWPDKIAQAKERSDALAHLNDVAAAQWASAMQAASASDAAQAQTNTAEAQSKNWYTGGWRPAVGWTCAVALASDFLVRPYLNAFTHVAVPALDMATLLFLVSGMLGLSTNRMLEKFKGVAS